MNLMENKKKLLFSSVVILLPIVFGLLIWDQLPDIMTTHWGPDNQPDGWSSKSFAVFGMPVLLLAMHWLCLWITSLDKSQKNQSKKAIAMIYWIIPVLSLFCSANMYGIALGNTVNIGSLLFILMGLMFMGIGNYLPKTKQNYYLGIKVIWTLRSEENWNATHRFCGKVWVFGGLLLTLAAFFPVGYAFYAILPIILVLAILPMLYSYLYYKKMCKEGRGYSLKMQETDKTTKTVYRVSMIILAVVLVILFNAMFVGDINCEFGDTSFTIEADHYDDLTVDYSTIDTVELRSEPVSGSREFGFGSPRLLLGVFKNEEFGIYTRYTYTKSECTIVIHSGEKVLVLAAKTPEETQSIYAEILVRLEG